MTQNTSPRYQITIGVADTFNIWDSETGEFPARQLPTREAAEAAIAELATSPTKPTQPKMQPGWSKAARRRTAQRTGKSHPLGDYVDSGDGYTVYEDTAFGGGRVTIYDES